MATSSTCLAAGDNVSIVWRFYVLSLSSISLDLSSMLQETEDDVVSYSNEDEDSNDSEEDYDSNDSGLLIYSI